LANVVIVDLICRDLVQYVSTMTTHVITIVAQDKARSYIEQALGDDFIPLAIEAYGYFHLRFDFFLTSCVHVNITHR